MLIVYQVSFFVGLGLTILGFIFGSLLDIGEIGGIDLDFFDADIYFPISPNLIFLFLTVFGGTGWILANEFSSIIAVIAIPIAISLGIGVSFLMYRFILKPLKKAQNTSAPDEEEVIGTQAKVTETIQEKGFGEIRYVVNGNSYTAPAKHIREEKVPLGEEVVICWIKEHTFYVIGMKEELDNIDI